MTLLFKHTYNWEPFTKFGERMYVKKNTFIYEQNKIGDGVYYIEKGLVKITTKTTKGNRLLKIALPSDIIGVQSMDQIPHHTTATAMENLVVYFFSYSSMKALMVEHPHLNHIFWEAVIHELNTFTAEVCEYKLPATQKMAKLLLNIYDEFRQFNIPLTQKDLAESLGITRVTVYNIMEEWKLKNYIEMKKGSILINDYYVLKQFAKELY